MARKRKKSSGDKEAYVSRQHLFDMEPELRMLEGVVAALQALTMTADAVEPIALLPLAHLGGDALQRLLSIWREAFAAQRSQAGEALPR